MNANAADLYAAAERLDESPVELTNGGAADALRALEASAADAEVVAAERGIDVAAVQALWERAGARLRAVPADADAVFVAAADAAALLYSAAWIFNSDAATTEGLLNLL